MEENVSIDDDKEGLAKNLHNKSPLPSLRTYQGDVASFIQSKDQSLSSLAIKARKVEETKEENLPKEPVENRKDYSTNALALILGLVLVVGSILAISYAAYFYFQKLPVSIPLLEIGPFLNKQNSVVITSESPGSIKQGISEIVSNPKYLNGVTHVEMEIKSNSFINEMRWNLEAPLLRSLEDEFMLGAYGDGKKVDVFIIFKTRDYGIAFRDMLIWEEHLFEDWRLISGLEPDKDYSVYKFRDLILKNKDTRSLSSDFGETVLIYTFLDKNTILITESEETLIAILDAYLNKNVVR